MATRGQKTSASAVAGVTSVTSGANQSGNRRRLGSGANAGAVRARAESLRAGDRGQFGTVYDVACHCVP